MIRALPNLKIFIILIILSLLIILLDSIYFLSLPKQLASFLTNPISFGLYETNKKIARQLHFITSFRSSAQENKALKEQLGQVLSENARLRKNLAETQSQLSQEKFLDPSTYNLVPARPIGITRYLKIDKGLNQGLKVGQAVVFNDNFIGKIVQISQETSNIQLLADPDSKVAAFSQGLLGKAKGVLAGQFGIESLMDKILQEEKISPGDLVYTEGTEGFLPRGLILGRVSQVFERENEVFKQAKVQSNFDLRDLELVYVIQE